MSGFSGFRAGCPGEVIRGDSPYVNTIAHFQASGKKLTAEEAGRVVPDSVRVVPVDDYLASTYRDKVFAFSEQAAEEERERTDPLIPEGNIITLEEDQIVQLNEACGSCGSGGAGCPALELVLEQGAGS